MILFSAMRNIYFIGFYTISLCAPQANTFFHPQEELITSMNLTGVVVCMKPLKRLRT